MKKPDGGPAFGEFKQAHGLAIQNGGISIRDYFAAKAMQQFIGKYDDEDISFSNNAVASMAYSLADAMLVEREKP